MKNILLITCLLIISCTSRIKDGANLTIYNETSSDIYIIDKYTIERKTEKFIDIFDNGFSSDRNKKIIHLKDNLITMYTNKTIFFPLKDYEKNKAYNALIFYFIKREDLAKTKQDIFSNKLYDSIRINLDKFHQEGSDNHLYIEENKSEFKNN